MDVKRIAFETKPINHAAVTERTPQRAVFSAPLDRTAITALVDRFLAERQHQPTQPQPTQPPPVPYQPAPSQPIQQQQAPQQSSPPPASTNGVTNHQVYDFVCEEDVRRAINAREKIYINNKTLITPAARDLGEERDVFARA
jgi:hypothetical protein